MSSEQGDVSKERKGPTKAVRTPENVEPVRVEGQISMYLKSYGHRMPSIAKKQLTERSKCLAHPCEDIRDLYSVNITA
ncbi:hypothetical protein TNCV_4721281 [Trichonephila clavipes]|uniref:Uncharacterized protein n=1 Tax=Trichonephila clavipes TaxID=2585209 RepID=A0A8X6W663_TRICX|nr:hypothetical protein TNCV_4721281 [Trichonephila clavipes]